MKDLIMLFGVTLAKRYTKNQKRIFYSQAIPFFEKLGYKVEFQRVKSKFTSIENIFIGNINTAKYIILCPYDTPSKALLSTYKYYPFNCSENRRQENTELFLRSAFFIISCLLAYFIYSHYFVVNRLLKIISIILAFLLLVVGYVFLKGSSNSVNFNRNSASVALIASLAKGLKNNPSVSFVLLDENVSSNLGLRIFAQDERIKNKILIYLDCVSYGEYTACVHGYSTSTEAKRLINSLPELELIERVFNEERLKNTNLQIFPNLLHICVGSIEEERFFVKNTRSKNDFRVDIPRLEKLRDGLLCYLQG